VVYFIFFFFFFFSYCRGANLSRKDSGIPTTFIYSYQQLCTFNILEGVRHKMLLVIWEGELGRQIYFLLLSYIDGIRSTRNIAF
jgi:hypothetical protein